MRRCHATVVPKVLLVIFYFLSSHRIFLIGPLGAFNILGWKSSDREGISRPINSRNYQMTNVDPEDYIPNGRLNPAISRMRLLSFRLR